MEEERAEMTHKEGIFPDGGMVSMYIENSIQLCYCWRPLMLKC